MISESVPRHGLQFPFLYPENSPEDASCYSPRADYAIIAA
jgi:hypothetical protein